jgi:hypothetical protein
VYVSSPSNSVAVFSSDVKHECSYPFAMDFRCSCCGIISLIGKSGAYITLSITNIFVSLFSCFILSCMVPLPIAVRPHAMPFKVVF